MPDTQKSMKKEENQIRENANSKYGQIEAKLIL
jgi:hypothetical protein